MKAYTYILLAAFISTAWAKLDPSTSVLVKRGTAAVEEVEELDSTRYEVRTVQTPVVVKKVKASKTQLSADQAVAKTSNTSATAGGVDVETEQVRVIKVQAPAQTTKRVIVKEELVEVEPPRPQVNYKEVRLQTEPTTVPLSQQLQIFLLGDPQEIQNFRDQLHPMDTKNNKLELGIAPYLYYADSKSSSWYRNYYFASLGLAGDAKFWFTPFFGMHIAYQSSLGASMPGNPAGTVQSSVNYQTTEAGIRFRKYFGLYRKAPQMTYGIDWQDQRINTSGDGNERMNIGTQGLSLSAEALVPSTLAYSQIFNFSFVPRPWESETQATNASSGGAPEVYMIGVGYGGLYQLDRYHQLFWRIQQRYQKSNYKGTGSGADPITGLTPTRISVTESTTFFYFGIQFGQ